MNEHSEMTNIEKKRLIEERIERLKKELESRGAKSLHPADFYFAFKQGIIQPYLSEGTTFTVTPSIDLKGATKEVKRAFVLENLNLSTRELMAITGFSSVYINKLKKKTFELEEGPNV